MLKNLLITAWRGLLRNKAFSLINILGLALGLTCSLLIILWVRDERNMNAFHANKADLYAVYERILSENKVDAAYWTPGVLAAELKRRLPEIRYASAFFPQQSAAFQAGEKSILMDGAAADSDLFKMFSYPILEGAAATALDAPDKIAISRKMAVVFFGSPAAAIHQTIRYNNARVLAMFTAEQRTKEIGIRKVLGASELNIFGMLSKDFLQLVGLALVIASPVAWLLMNDWLREYAYRTNIAWWIFAAAGLSALLVALLTVSVQALKAALANPTSSLRTE